jgi:ParB-like nuclease family protein
MQCEGTKDIKVLQISCSDADRELPPLRAAIEAMKKSLQTTGQISPIGVHPVTRNTYRVIVGATRFRAASELGWTTIRASIWNGSANDFLIHQLAENVERRDLSAEQRRNMRAKIRELQRQQVANVKAAKGGRGRKGGLREAARDAGIPRATARRRAGKLGHNIESGPVSAPAAEPQIAPLELTVPAPAAEPRTVPSASSAYATRKVTFDLKEAEYRPLIKKCEGERISISEGIRRAIREWIKPASVDQAAA